MVRVDKRSDASVRVLRVGDSFLLSRHIMELEIILFRSLNPGNLEPKPVSSLPCILPTRRKRTSILSNITSFDASASRRVTPAIETVGNSAIMGSSTLQPTQQDDSSLVKPPLFFDSAVCLFLDRENKTDYATIGRYTTDNKGIQHKPHAVVIGNESIPHAYCTYNVDLLDVDQDVEELYRGTETETVISHDSVRGGTFAVNNGATMAAGDGFFISFKRINMCTGLLISATLFGKDITVRNGLVPYYMVRRPKSSLPLCLVPLRVSFDHYKSVISIMIRKIKIRGETLWELVNVSEPLAHENVKNIISAMEKRGLADPVDYQRDFDTRGLEGAFERTVSGMESGSQDEDEDENMKEGKDDVQSVNSHEFNDLLSNIPHVMREGRKQYNVGRSYIHTSLVEEPSSEDDAIIDDALRAVVPQYTNNSVVRYEYGAYNVGSKIETLVSHYVNHRKEYGLKAAMSGSSRDISKPQSLLVSGAFNNISATRRFSTESDPRRPSFPIELQTRPSINAKERQKGGWNPQHRGTLSNTKRATLHDYLLATSMRKKYNKKGKKHKRIKKSRPPGSRTISGSRKSSSKQRGRAFSANKSALHTEREKGANRSDATLHEPSKTSDM
ncbi:unnamed protein product [Phytomonas sp. EM1]|nr:unnamed protein product [Phytomonas sp. EM1]|eukprot:CCW65121.1 unnamed protein product [Phytomonas sp. isolate EM1]